MRLIDADAELKEARELSGPQTGDGWDNWGVYALIERQPTIDAIPAVRCKDCRHYWKNGGDNSKGAVCLASPSDDAFCSEGEREDDGVDS